MIPDLLSYWLTGEAVAEVTNASTTGLLDIRTRRWSAEICRPRSAWTSGCSRRVRRRARRWARCWPRRTDVAAATPVPVCAVGSHDTASAVVGVPARTERFAYISCGTWSLVGLELTRPVLTEDSRPPTSPTSAASTAPSATCATSWACGCCRSRCARGRRTASPYRSTGCCARRPTCRP